MKFAQILAILIISLTFIQGANYIDPSTTEKPQCSINSWACYDNGGEFGYNEDGSCFCDMSNAPAPSNSIGNYLSSKITTGSGAPTGERILNSQNSPTGQVATSNKETQTEVCFPTYSYGYVKDGKYCAEEYVVRFPNGQARYTQKNVFVEQKNISEECFNNFECKSNYCSERICKNQTEEISNKITGEVSASVDKEIDERKDEAINQLETKLENLDENKTYSVKVDNVEIPVNKNIMKQVLNWFREILE